MVIKHKNMKDVAALVVSLPQGYSRDEPFRCTVWWVNLRGTVDYPHPFICSPRPEEIFIKDPKNWEDLELGIVA